MFTITVDCGLSFVKLSAKQYNICTFIYKWLTLCAVEVKVTLAVVRRIREHKARCALQCFRHRFSLHRLLKYSLSVTYWQDLPPTTWSGWILVTTGRVNTLPVGVHGQAPQSQSPAETLSPLIPLLPPAASAEASPHSSLSLQHSDSFKYITAIRPLSSPMLLLV